MNAKTTPLSENGMTFELSLVPGERFVSTVRRFVEEGLEKIITDDDLVFRISMAVHELLENASRYASKRWVSLHLRADEPDANGAGHAEVILRNESSAENLQHLQTIVDEIANAPDPMLKYQEMMRRSSRRRDGSGLGLIRIRAEGEMSLSVQIHGTEVHTTAALEYRAGGSR